MNVKRILLKSLNNNYLKKENFIENIVISSLKISMYVIIPNIIMIILVIIISKILNGKIIINVNNADDFFSSIMVFSLPLVFSYVIIPIIITKKFEKISLNKIGLIFNKNTMSIIFLIVLSLLLLVLIIITYNLKLPVSPSTIVVSFFFVAVSEEVLLRGIIYYELENTFKPIIALIISSLMFSFIFHSGGNDYINLFVRFPLGLFFGFIRIKTGNIYNSIMLHWIYNIFVSII